MSTFALPSYLFLFCGRGRELVKRLLKIRNYFYSSLVLIQESVMKLKNRATNNFLVALSSNTNFHVDLPYLIQPTIRFL